MISVFVGGYLMALVFQPISGVEAYQQLLMGGFVSERYLWLPTR